jgi:AcrR family transcriptional regulator
MNPASDKTAIKPRKTPRQARSEATVEAILQAAAHILERSGFDGYSTNAIARVAGVSIGSLYQYFPTRDAITYALIREQKVNLARDIMALEGAQNETSALTKIIEIAVQYQLDRPALSRILDLEEARLPQEPMQDAQSVTAVFRHALAALNYPTHDVVIRDLVAIIRGMVDAAGQNDRDPQDDLTFRVEAAVFGYLERRWGGDTTHR